MNGTWSLLKKTLPFIWVRLLIYAAFAVGSILVLAILLGIGVLLSKLFGSSSGALWIGILIFVFAMFGIIKFLERYVLYLLKAAHIAVLVELMDHGEVPDGKGQIAYGKERVTSMFGATSAFFAVDQLVSASVKQIHRWLMRLGEFLNVIPGAKHIIGIISMILGIALNYIDEAVLSRVMKQKKEQPDGDIWKTSADGVVLYAQSWKKMIWTATGVAVFTIAVTLAAFLITLFPLMMFSKWIYGDAGFVLGFIAFLAALAVAFAIKAALVDPVATIAMIRTYHAQTSGVTPSFDLKEKMLGVSKKFRELVSREGTGAQTVSGAASTASAHTGKDFPV